MQEFYEIRDRLVELSKKIGLPIFEFKKLVGKIQISNLLMSVLADIFYRNFHTLNKTKPVGILLPKCLINALDHDPQPLLGRTLHVSLRMLEDFNESHSVFPFCFYFDN